MRRTPRRLLARTVGAALILLALAPAAIPQDHRLAAADRGLVVLMQTRYDAVLDRRLIRVTIDAQGTSYTPNTDAGLPYYSGFKFAIPAEAKAVSASSAGQRLSTKVGAVQDTFREIEVTFSRNVFYQESYAFRVAFELPDTGGAPDRDLRVGSNIVAFPVLAYGSPGEAGSGVEAVLPAGFRASVQGSAMVSATGPDGEVTLSASNLADPFDFYAYLAADRPGTFGEHHLLTTVGGRSAALWVRNWEDDPDWGTRMSDLMTRGLPALQQLIGLPYPVSGTLVVEEAAPTRLGDYAGTYTQTTGTILVRYDADAFVGLHEAAHIWFNETLVDERWINEGFAELYGVHAARVLGEQGDEFSLTDDLLKLRIPLNDWGVPGSQDPDTESFAYAASYHVTGLILSRTSLGGLRTVWQGVADGELAYQPRHATGDPETGVEPQLARWQLLLDLLDERTGSSYGDIWNEWVVDASQRSLMEDRAAARDQYAALLALARDWNTPTDLRSAMSSWNFDDAEAEMRVASMVLAARDEIAADAGALRLTPPRALRDAFQGNGGMAAAQAEATTELQVLAGLASAADRLDEDPGLFETIGLLGSNPEATLDAARAAFEADQLDAATARTAEVIAMRRGAESAGQLRVGITGGGVVVLGGGAFVGVRVRRRRRAATALAEQAAPVPIDPPAPDSRA
ncbi:MAG: hypothetical protein ACXWWU_06310 [Candidatus Limnocylindria bacterium]